MTRPFPAEDEQVTCRDGAMFLFLGGAWHWAGETQSAAERAHAARMRRRARLRLHRDLLAWLAACDETALVKTRGADLRQNDPREMWTELVLRASLTDSIAEVTDGWRLGIETHTQHIVAAVLGPVRAQAARIAIVRHRMRVAALVAHAESGFTDPLGKPRP